MHALSTAVFNDCALTSYGSQTPKAFISTIVPFSPSIPNVEFSPSGDSACFARSLVKVRMTFAPQFCANVRGITSNAVPMARKGSCSAPWTVSANLESSLEMAISTAPPPGSKRGSFKMFRATPMASIKLRSTSFKTSFEAPLKTIVHAFGSSQSTMNVKYSSPIFSTLNNPAPVPISDSCNSSSLWMMVAPVARAMRLLSVFLTRRIAVTFALAK